MLQRKSFPLPNLGSKIVFTKLFEKNMEYKAAARSLQSEYFPLHSTNKMNYEKYQNNGMPRAYKT